VRNAKVILRNDIREADRHVLRGFTDPGQFNATQTLLAGVNFVTKVPLHMEVTRDQRWWLRCCRQLCREGRSELLLVGPVLGELACRPFGLAHESLRHRRFGRVPLTSSLPQIQPDSYWMENPSRRKARCCLSSLIRCPPCSPLSRGSLAALGANPSACSLFHPLRCDTTVSLCVVSCRRVDPAGAQPPIHFDAFAEENRGLAAHSEGSARQRGGPP